MLRKRLAILMAFFMLSTPILANSVAVRDLAKQLEAQVEYDKESNSIEFTTDNVKLVIDLKTGIIKNKTTGKIVEGAKVSCNAGVTYVDAEQIIKEVNSAITVNNLSSFLSQLSSSITEIIYSTSEAIAKTAETIKTATPIVIKEKADDSDSDSDYSVSRTFNTQPTTVTTYQIVDIHVKDVWIIPGEKRYSRKGIETVRESVLTTSSAYGAVHCVWYTMGFKSNQDTFIDKCVTWGESGIKGYKYNLKKDECVILDYIFKNPPDACYYGGYSRVWDIDSNKEYCIPYDTEKENDVLLYGNEEFRELSNKLLEERLKNADWVFEWVE